MPDPKPQGDHYYSVLTRELEHVRAECNRLASERDLAVTERDAALAARDRAILGAANLLAANRDLSDQLKRALRPPERSAA